MFYLPFSKKAKNRNKGIEEWNQRNFSAQNVVNEDIIGDAREMEEMLNLFRKISVDSIKKKTKWKACEVIGIDRKFCVTDFKKKIELA